MRRSLVALALSAVAAAACFNPSYPQELPCGPQDWCPPGQSCNAAGLCVATADGDGGPDGDSGNGGMPDASELGNLLSISIGDDVVLPVEGTHQFVIIGTYENGTAEITDFAMWESSDNAIASVDFTGLATARSAGAATITARYQGRIDAATVTVTAP
jgi:hypothetical protein